MPRFSAMIGESEETRAVDIERQEQQPAGNAVLMRIGQDEGKRDKSVKGEIEHDIEEAAEIRLHCRARDGAVQPVTEPACNDQNEAPGERTADDGESRPEPIRKPAIVTVSAPTPRRASARPARSSHGSSLFLI